MIDDRHQLGFRPSPLTDDLGKIRVKNLKFIDLFQPANQAYGAADLLEKLFYPNSREILRIYEKAD